jgi:hypothetical protein
MPSQEEFEQLKGRIVELENQLKWRRRVPDVSAITPEDIQAFVKVRDAIAPDWVCWILPCCHFLPCHACGPGNSPGGAGGGVGRFGGLGG